MVSDLTIGRIQLILYLAQHTKWINPADLHNKLKPTGISSQTGTRKALTELSNQKFLELENVGAEHKNVYRCRLKKDVNSFKTIIELLLDHKYELVIFMQTNYYKNMINEVKALVYQKLEKYLPILNKRSLGLIRDEEDYYYLEIKGAVDSNQSYEKIFGTRRDIDVNKLNEESKKFVKELNEKDKIPKEITQEEYEETNKKNTEILDRIGLEINNNLILSPNLILYTINAIEYYNETNNLEFRRTEIIQNIIKDLWTINPLSFIIAYKIDTYLTIEYNNGDKYEFKEISIRS